MNKIKTQPENSSKTNSGFFASLSTEEKFAYAGLALIVLLIFLIRSKFLLIPFERDEGAYSYYGKLLLEGKTPYVDFYEQKFPGVFYFYAFIVMLFGETVKDLHMGFIFLNIATTIILFFAAKKLFNSLAAIITALTFAFVSLTPIISGFTIQSEHGVAFFSSLGILFYVLARQNKKWFYYLLMGLSMGAAFMTKTTGVFMALWGGLILLIDFFFGNERKIKNIISSLGWYAVGGFSVIGILFLLIFLKGSFEQMIFWTIDIPKYYVNRVPLEEGLKYFDYTKTAIFQFNKFLWVHALFAVLIIIVKGIKWNTKLLIITLGIFSFMTIVPGYYFYGHYWIQLVPGVSILAGATFFAIQTLLKTQFKIESKYVAYAYIGLFVILIYSHLEKNKTYYFKPNYDLIMRSTYGYNPFPETMEIAKYINANSKPEDQVAVIGSEPEFYIYTNKKAPSRHIFFSTIVADVPQHKEWQREYVKDIEATKPKFFIFYSVPISLLVQANTDQYVFEWANKYVNENYQLIGLCDMIDGQRANYIWKEQLMNYKPSSQNVIYIYERKQTTAADTTLLK